MKKSILALGLLLVMSNAFSKDIKEMLFSTALAPFGLSTQALETMTVTGLVPINMTIVSTQRRGISGKEQLKDELVAFNEDFSSGKINSIDDVRQPALKELFSEIAADENQMNGINELVPEGNEVTKIGAAVTLALMTE